MGKLEFPPIVTPKPHNRSSKKVAYVIISQISTHLQNLVAIPQGVSFPRMREFASKMFTRLRFFGVPAVAHSPGP